MFMKRYMYTSPLLNVWGVEVVRERGGEEGARERGEGGKGQEVGVGRRVPGLVGWRRGGGEVGGTTNRELQPTPEKAPQIRTTN